MIILFLTQIDLKGSDLLCVDGVRDNTERNFSHNGHKMCHLKSEKWQIVCF